MTMFMELFYAIIIHNFKSCWLFKIVFSLDYILCREDLTESFTLIIVIKCRLKYIFPILQSLPWMVQK